MAKLVKADGSVLDVLPSNGVKFTLKEMQTFVGGFIEFIPSDSPLFVLCINEDGKAMRLARNETATRMVSQAGMMMDDFIVGDILIGTGAEFGFED